MDIKPNQNVISNSNGQLQSVTGEKAVDAFALRALIVALKFELNCPGMKMSRISALKVAKQRTGLKTNNRALQIQRLKLMMEQTVSECAVVTDGEMQ